MTARVRTPWLHAWWLGVVLLGPVAAPAHAGELAIPLDGTPVSVTLDPRWQPIGQRLTLEGPLAGWLGTDRVPDVRDPQTAAHDILRRRFTSTQLETLARALSAAPPLSDADAALCRDAALTLWAWVATQVCVQRAGDPMPNVTTPLLDESDPAVNVLNGMAPFGSTMRQYAYGLCGSQSYQLVALGQAAGFSARIRSLASGPTYHATVEIGWGDAWHLFDPSLRFVPRDAGHATIPSIDRVVGDPTLVARVQDADGIAPRAPARAAAHAEYYALPLTGTLPVAPESVAPPLVLPAGARLTLLNVSTSTAPLQWGPKHVGSGTYEVPVDGGALPTSYQCWSRGLTSRPTADGVQLRTRGGKWGTLIYSVPAPYPIAGGAVICDAIVPPAARVEVAVSTALRPADRRARFGTLAAARTDWRFGQERDMWLHERRHTAFGALDRLRGFRGDPARADKTFYPAFADKYIAQPFLGDAEWQVPSPEVQPDGRLRFPFTGTSAPAWPLAIRLRIRDTSGAGVVLRRLALEARVQHAPQTHAFARGGPQTWQWTPHAESAAGGGRITLAWPEPPDPAPAVHVAWTVSGTVPADGNGFVRATARVTDSARQPVAGYVVRARSARPEADRVLPFPRSPLPPGATPGGMYLEATDEEGTYTVLVFSRTPGETRLWLEDATGHPLPGDAHARFADPPV